MSLFLKNKLSKFRHSLFEAVPIHSLVVVRIVFGFCLLWECYDHFANNIIEVAYIEPKFHFKYYGFEWVKLPPPELIPWLFCLLCVLAIFVAIGLFYRTSLALFTLGFTYVFLWDKTQYMNHFYMMILFGVMLLFMPANRYFSLDAYFDPRIKAEKTPFWSIFFIRLQFEIVLLFAGLVKVNYDWLTRAMPLKLWLPEVKTNDTLHYLFTQDWALFSASYGSIILHLVGAPLLLFKRTRIYVFCVYCCFHLLNHISFPIGSFPWLSIGLTTIFFNPDWPKKIFKFFDKSEGEAVYKKPNLFKQNLIISAITIWAIIQILVPLRFLLYPGHIIWTKEGYLFAWRLKLDDYSGSAYYYIHDAEMKKVWRAMPNDYITYVQYRKMQCDPEMILQLSHHIYEAWLRQNNREAKIKISDNCSVNGRKGKPQIDSNADLAHEKISFKHKAWVTPFEFSEQ